MAALFSESSVRLYLKVIVCFVVIVQGQPGLKEILSQNKKKNKKEIKKKIHRTDDVLTLSCRCLLNNKVQSQAWWLSPVIPAPKRLRQEDHDELEISLSYETRPHEMMIMKAVGALGSTCLACTTP